MVTNCTDDQNKTLTRIDLILRELIRQTPANRSEGQCFAQFNKQCWWRRKWRLPVVSRHTLLLAVVLSIQVANVVLTTVVTDQSVARTQSPEAVTKMALASDVVVVQVSRQLPTPRGRSPSTGERNAAAVSIGKFMNPALFDMCR